MCIRQERGRCKVEYSKTDDPISFKITKPASKGSTQGRNGNDCTADYVIIPRGRPKSYTVGVAMVSKSFILDTCVVKHIIIVYEWPRY